MRFGRLLVQANPEELLVQHGLPTLEAVFLKLCQLDSAQIPEGIKTDSSSFSESKNDVTLGPFKEKISINTEGNDGNNNNNNNNNSGSETKGSIQNEKNFNNNNDNNNNNSNEENNNNNNNAIALAANKTNNLLMPMTAAFKDVSARATPSTQSPRMSFSDGSRHEVFALQNQISVQGERRRAFDLNRVMALFIKNAIRLKRNVPILLFYFFLPSIQIALFCICIGQDPKNIPVAIYNAEDPPGLSAEYLSFVNSEIVVQIPYQSLEEARQAVVDGKAWAALHFSHNYSASLNQRRIMVFNEDDVFIDAIYFF
ncbi:VWA domain-containing protein [Sarcoptes scabiei]|nr:VWA domain-containing protein [Sarcoptes scabiei]